MESDRKSSVFNKLSWGPLRVHEIFPSSFCFEPFWRMHPGLWKKSGLSAGRQVVYLVRRIKSWNFFQKIYQNVSQLPDCTIEKVILKTPVKLLVGTFDKCKKSTTSHCLNSQMLDLGHQLVSKWMENENAYLSILIACSILNCPSWIIHQKDIIGYEIKHSNSESLRMQELWSYRFLIQKLSICRLLSITAFYNRNHFIENS